MKQRAGVRALCWSDIMDIQGVSNAQVHSAGSPGQSGASESVAVERKAAADSTVERKEAEPSSTGPDVGNRVDINA